VPIETATIAAKALNAAASVLARHEQLAALIAGAPIGAIPACKPTGDGCWLFGWNVRL
jgi:hypothetical protein